MTYGYIMKTCPNCPAVEKVLPDHGFGYEKIYTEDKPVLVSYCGVLSVPTLFDFIGAADGH